MGRSSSPRRRFRTPSPQRYRSRSRSAPREPRRGRSRSVSRRACSRSHSPRRARQSSSSFRVEREPMGRYGPTSGSGGDGYKSRGSGGRFKGDQTDDFFEERKRKRDNTNFSIWAGIPSPPPMKKRAKKEKMEPTPSPSRFRSVSRSMSRSRSDSRSRSRSSSRSFSDSESDVSSSESEDERRRSRKSTRKHKSKRRSHKKKSSKKSKKHKKESKSRRKRRRSPSLSEGRRSGSESDVSVASERKEDRKLSVDMSDVDENDNREAEKFKEAVQGSHNDEDEEEIGPKPLQTTEETAALSMNYGKALLPGEGAAIAQFVQKNMRIPRRGEVGWNGEEIENLENLGYVMSGSRHKRMNAVRIRKENQVYTAEEKRALALINFEEKQQRENAVMNDFKEMLTERLTKKHGSRLVEDMESSAKE